VRPLFGRRRAGDDTPAPADTPAAAVDPSGGPFDGDADVPAARRLDLGALRIPVVDGLQLQVEVDRASKAPRSVTVVHGPSRVRLSAFAAPRSSGVWEDIRSEISAEVTKVGGTAKEVDGPFGAELLTTIPTKLPDGRQAVQVQRFAGVDGPRWFLRAVFSGPEVVTAAGIAVPGGRDDLGPDPDRLRVLEDVVRGCVVVRGPHARPPREPLPLQLPSGTNAATTETTTEPATTGTATEPDPSPDGR
jgi:hypothetical protein